jgi:trimethylamine--corrinoid protein Co-methyltransferase
MKEDTNVNKKTPIQTAKPMIQVLSEDQVSAIHDATLQILAEIGVDMQDPQGRELLLDAGAEEGDGRIKVPENLVTDCIEKAPSSFPLYDRLGEDHLQLEIGNTYFGPGSDTTFTLDLETGARRRTTSQDVENMARIANGLENIDFVMSMANPSDVPPDDLYVHAFMSMLRGSTKPNIYTAKNRRDMEDIYRIAVAVAGSEKALREKPFFLLYAEPISPLLILEESLQKVIFCAEKGVPGAYLPSPNTGGGGPITLAGAIALGNVECLVGLIISQIINPGTPYLYGMNTAAMDMKSAIVSYGSPEWSLGMAAWTDLARFYNLPSWGYAGATDSKVVDTQAGIEATFSTLSSLLTRCTIVHDIGYIEYGSTSSAELLVIVDEIISMARFYMQGVQIDDTTLALDAIARVQPGSGFLADNHTLDNWRWAQWAPSLINRQRYDSWKDGGEKDLRARANERALKLLEESDTAPLPDEAEAVFNEVIRERT